MAGNNIWASEIVPLRLKQHQLACSFCKVRKIKCDEQRPSCSACVKHGRADACSFRTQQQGQAQERDYVGYLERRIGLLEQSLSDGHIEKEEEVRHFGESVNEIDAVDASWSLGAKFPLQVPGIILASADVKGILPRTAEAVEDTTRPSLPQKRTGSKLIQYYLDHIYVLTVPFISARTLWSQFDLVYGADFNTSGRNDDCNTAWFNVLIVMAIAISSLSHKGHSIVSPTASGLFRQAAHCFLSSGTSTITEDTLHGALFLIQYASLNPSELNVGYIVNACVRMCEDLELHRNSDPDSKLAQTRKSLFWAAFCIDRSFCISRSMPCGLPRQMLKDPFPGHDMYSLYHTQKCRILHLQSVIFDELYMNNKPTSPNVVAHFANEIAAWKQENASSLTSSHTTRLLTQDYYHTLILLYRPCRALKERLLDDILLLWRYSLEYARFQKEFEGEIVDLATSTEWAFTTGLALIYSFSALIRYRNHHGALNKMADVQIGNLWIGTQCVTHTLQTISAEWADARPIVDRFEQIVAKGIAAAVGRLMDGRADVAIPSEITEFWKHGNVTRGVTLDGREENRKQDIVEDLVCEIVRD